MTNTKMIKAVNDEALEAVAGGNQGDDCREEKSRTPLHNVGETVEVFRTFLHVFTKRGTIIDKFQVDVINSACRDWKTNPDGLTMHWKYLVKLEDGSEECVTAEEIERK